eukprot:scaffold1.g5851.t1
MPPKKAGKNAKSAREHQETAEEVLEAAEWAFMREDFKEARRLYKRAVELEPESPRYLDAFGAFLADVGDAEQAVAVLRKAVGLAPDAGFEKYMYLAQLLEGQDAQAAARKGIEICRARMARLLLEGQDAQAAARKGIEICRARMARLEQQAAAAAPPPEGGAWEGEEEDPRETLAELKEQLSSCLCALAELLLNDEAEAEAGAEGGVRPQAADELLQLLGEATGLNPRSPEPLQIRASLAQQQGEAEQALGLLRQSMALWFKPHQEAEEEGEEEGAAGDEAAEEDLGEEDSSKGEEMDEDDEDLPSYEFETAKMLLELDPDVLEQLAEENDQVPNVHMLLAVCYLDVGELELGLQAVEEGTRWAKAAGLPADDEVVLGLGELDAELRALSAAGGGGGGGDAGGEGK